ncbi:MAG: DUF5689 domain-containing protein [Saprospiraceae bacterium]
MLSLFALVTLMFTACIEKDFDTPPVEDNSVEINATHSVADLKDYFVLGEFTEITDDLIVDAIVIADDEGGNFYKKLVLQDETGGIEILLNRNDIYTTYEEGRELGVKAKGLYISDYNGVIQLGGAPTTDNNGNLRLGQLDDALIDDFFLLGSQVGLPAAKEISITEFGPSDISTLIKLCDVQFASSDTTGQMADAVGQLTLNKTLEDCNFNTILVRTSGYADVASTDVPNGKGCVTAVYGVFRDDKQLFIRTSADLDLNDGRCGGGGSGGGGGTAGTVTLTIEQVRGLFNGSATNLPTGQGIQAVVISDLNSGTTTGRNMIIQQDGWGIIVRFDDFHNFNLGDEVFLDVSGVELSEFNGGLQLNNVSVSNAVLVSANQTPAPRVLTVAEITSNFERYEGTLVTIKGATLSPDDNDWAFTTNLSDGTGSLAIFTYAQATFAGQTPSTDTVDVTGYLNEFNSPQLVLRTLADVVVSGGSSGGGGGGGGGGTGSALTSFTEDFEGNADFDPVAATGWMNTTNVSNGRTWQAREFDSNIYAQATAYNDTAPSVDAWLVTPELDFSAGLQIAFETATAFNVHQGLEVLVSTDYVGSGDPSTATWTPLSGAAIANGSSGDNTWVPSGNVSLASYSGQGFVAFRYTGAGSGNTSTFRVDNVVVSTL